jgi:5-methylcytosine-specific restriction endonuclease McrA
VLREVKNAGWAPQGAWWWKRYVFAAGDVRAARGVKPHVLAEAEAAQGSSAVLVLSGHGRRYWWCLDRFFWEDDGLTTEDVFALAYERQLRARRKLERAHATVAVGQAPSSRRRGVPLEIRRAVWDRDGGRCAVCGSTFELQFDHVIPVALGGATSEQNLQVLCGACNRAKGAALG